MQRARRFTLYLLSVLFLAATWVATGTAAPSPDARQVEFFEKKIRPVLVKHCYKCHSTDSKEVKGGLRLDSRAHTLAGGDSGEALIPGEPDESLLIQSLRYDDLEMPPKRKLPEAVIADFETWIANGAVDPRVDKAVAVVQDESIDWDKARQFWAFQPVNRPEVPAVRDTEWPAGPIDHFILSRLEAEKLRPAKEVDRRTLIRRLYFDLIGLPPSPSDVESFVNDDSPQALPRLVDRLLASEQFGERWARYWLDVARYGESTGRERNHTYPHAWRYRDYVIDAFNNDVPYDQFVTEQIAGDLLEYESDEQRQRQLIATGYLAIGTKALNERDRRQFDLNTIDDQIDTVSRSVLGLTVGCARCHDHKFDPIPTADYYALAGIFGSSETLFGVVKFNGVRQTSKLMRLGDDDPEESANQPDVEEQLKKSQSRKARILKGLQAVRKKANRDAIRRALKQLEAVDAEIAALKAGEGEWAMGVRERKSPQDFPIYVRGEVENVGPRVPRGFLTILEQASVAEIPKDQSGRRELADWLTSPENPLAARVFVNRVWQHLIGNGIVASSGNFGTSGEQPSHPELLDWLAAECLEQGWSRKQVIRAIVLSKTYRQGSDYDLQAFKKDPSNRLCWRHPIRRVEAEVLRDSILQVSGQLNLDRPTGSQVAELGDRIINNLQSLSGVRSTVSTNRSIYLPIVRNVVPEMLNVFDFAEPSMVVTRRQETTAPAQALYMMNSAFVREQARLFAQAILADHELSDEQRLRQMVLRAVGRSPSAEEIERTKKFINDSEADWKESGSGPAQAKQQAWALYAQALFASAEFRYIQ